jgi:hypothetical protein
VIATALTETALRDFLDQYATASGDIQGDPATIAAEAAAAGLVERDGEAEIEGDAVLLYRDKVVVKHDDYVGDPPLRWIIEELIAIGSVPVVSGCEHETIIEFDIPVKSLWVAAEMVQELDVTLAGYGVHVKDQPFGFAERNMVRDVWRNTCNEAMRLMYAR